MAKRDIHHKKEGLKNFIERLKNPDEIESKKVQKDVYKNISDKNRDLILKFIQECKSQGLSDTRAYFYAKKLLRLAHWVEVDFDRLEKEDVKRLVADIERSNYYDGEWSGWTKQNYKVTIKKFFQWLGGYEWKSKKYPEKVDWIKICMNGNSKIPEEIISKEEIRRMIGTAKQIRNKAIIAVLYESGCRIGEFLSLKMKNVDFDRHGATLIVEGKTGRRRVRIIESVNFLEQWLGCHPKGNDREAFLFITIAQNSKGKPLEYQVVRKMLKRVAKKAGIEKQVNPHNFRHSRATHLANKLTEAQMSEFFGWKQGSKMPSIYVHLSGRDVDNALLRIYGKLQDKDDEGLIKCPRCGEFNNELFRFCKNCGQPFDIEWVKEEDKKKGTYDKLMSEFMKRIVEDEEMKEKAKGILAELMNKNKGFNF